MKKKFLFSGIQARMALLMLFAFLPAFILMISLVYNEVRREIADSKREAFILAKYASENLNKTIESSKHMLYALSYIDNIRTSDLEGLSVIFENLKNKYDVYENIFFVSMKGELLSSAEPVDEKVQERLSKWSKEASSAASVYFETLKYNFPKEDNPFLMAVPVKGFDGKPLGALAVTFNSNWFSSAAESSNIPKNVSITITNSSGLILARFPDYVSWTGRSITGSAALSSAVSLMEGTTRGTDLDNVEKIFGYTYLSDDLKDIRLIVGIPEDVAFGHIHKMYRNIALWGALSILTLIAAWIGGNLFILGKVSKLVDTTRKLSMGDLSARTGLDYNKGELGELARSLDMMAGFVEMRERELDERTQEYERSNNDLEQFAYVASHDLQEPLRMVSSYTQLLKRRYADKLDEDADEFIGFAVDGAARMQTLINDLLKYSRVGTKGKAFEPTDMNRVLEFVLYDLQVRINETGASVEHDKLPIVHADQSQMHQLLLNLVGNALKFIREENPVITVTYKDTGTHWEFCVSDNGVGIDEKYLDRIFVIFQRLHTREEYPGTGIGLAICKKIVERHKGKIWVESEPGEGSKFYFTIKA